MSNFSSSSSINQRGFQPTQYDTQTKGLLHQQSTTTKASETTNPELVQWYEDATAYYNAVISGDPNTATPDPAAWQDFMNQLQWAADQLGFQAPAWDPIAGAASGGGRGGLDAQAPAGATMGPMGNIVWNQSQAIIPADANGTTNDIWSNDIRLNVSSLSATITAEQTTDTRVQPNESVLKIIVHDAATGQESVYFVHDWQDANVKVNTPVQSQFTDNSHTLNAEGTDNLIQWNEYQETSAASPSAPEASIEGKVQDDGSILYEPEFVDTTIDFSSRPSEIANESQRHIVYANSTITVGPSDEVDVSTPDSDGMLKVTVTHRNGSKDVYEIQKGYTASINANEEYLKTDEPLSPELASRVSINGEQSLALSYIRAQLEQEHTDKPHTPYVNDAFFERFLKDAEGHGYSLEDIIKRIVDTGEIMTISNEW